MAGWGILPGYFKGFVRMINEHSDKLYIPLYIEFVRVFLSVDAVAGFT